MGGFRGGPTVGGHPFSVFLGFFKNLLCNQPSSKWMFMCFGYGAKLRSGRLS